MTSPYTHLHRGWPVRSLAAAASLAVLAGLAVMPVGPALAEGGIPVQQTIIGPAGVPSSATAVSGSQVFISSGSGSGIAAVYDLDSGTTTELPSIRPGAQRIWDAAGSVAVGDSPTGLLAAVWDLDAGTVTELKVAKVGAFVPYVSAFGTDGDSVAGYYFELPGPGLEAHMNAFVYDRATGTRTDIPTPYLDSAAYDVAGTTVVGQAGWFDDGVGPYHAFVYDTQTQAYLDINAAIGLNNSYAVRVQGDTVVGGAYLTPARVHGFIYDLSTGTARHFCEEALVCDPRGLDGDLVVGSLTYDGDTWHPFAYNMVTGDLTDLAPGQEGRAWAVDGTTVVGSIVDDQGTLRAAVWELGDHTAPAVTVPADIAAEGTSADGAQVSFEASGVDEVDGPVATTCAPESGTVFPLGTTRVECTAADAAGNTGTASFTVTVRDTTPPTLSGPEVPQVAEATGPDGAAVTLPVTATDAVDSRPEVTCSPVSGTFPLGDTPVSCTARDASGNISTALTWTVRVVDTTAPTVQAPDDLSVTATSAAGAVVTYPPAKASDTVDGAVAAACVPASGDMFPLGRSTLVCAATDRAGNTGRDEFAVTVTYAWSGILQPVNADGTSIFKAGATVPLKFRLSGASSGVTNAVAKVAYAKISNGIEGDFVEAVTNVAATAGNQFRYDPDSGQYIYNLSTKGLKSGTYVLRIDLGDGEVRSVHISLK